MQQPSCKDFWNLDRHEREMGERRVRERDTESPPASSDDPVAIYGRVGFLYLTLPCNNRFLPARTEAG